MKLSLLFIGLLGICGVVLATPEGFSAYQIIIDKHPFGDEPLEDITPEVPLSQSFARNLRIAMLSEGPGGDIRVGIVDNQKKRNYVLKVGEMEEDILVVEADMEKEEVLLQSKNQVVTLSLKEGPKTAAAPARKGPTSRQNSYAARRQAMIKKVQEQKKREQNQLTGEALEEHLKEVQMDAIRTGKPPLPMQLTPEMDDQLVSEGILDPQ